MMAHWHDGTLASRHGYVDRHEAMAVWHDGVTGSGHAGVKVIPPLPSPSRSPLWGTFTPPLGGGG